MRKLLRRVLLGVVAFYVAGAVWSCVHSPPVAVTVEEVVPPNEEDAILRLVRLATEAIEEHAKNDHFYKRDAHSVPHGCVRARLQVRPGLDEELRHGVFATPGKQYRAWIRFSNALKPDDRSTDGRGMAIKLMRASERDPSQDFLMVNGAAFFNRDVFEYEEFFHYQSQGAVQQVFYFIQWNPFRWRLHELRTALALTMQRVTSPLSIQYFSGLPYKLGPHNIKYSAKPCRPFEVAKPEDAGPHFLREAMVEHLEREPACFDFMVQLQDPTKEMPIEDPTVLWREEDSPFRPVARIEIPRQTFSSDAQNQFCEQLSFAPWQGLPAHRPIGGLNRARKAVYEQVSKRRHARNGFERREPKGWCLDLTGAACPDDPSYFLDDGGSP